MPEFTWLALDAQGREVKGSSTADNRQQLLHQLNGKGLLTVAIDGSSGATGPSGENKDPHPGSAAAPWRASKKTLERGKVSRADVLHFSAEFSLMMKSGLSLEAALRLLSTMSAKASMGQLIQALSAAVKNGAPLSKALAAHPQQFDDFYINMVRSGEASGKLATALEEVAAHLERQNKLRESVVSAALYPLILLIVAVLSLVAMLGFVVPQFQNLFDDLGSALPLPTQVVVGLGRLFTEHGVAMFVGFALLVLALMRWFASQAGTRQKHELILRLPLLGAVAYKYQLSLFFRTMGTLLQSGVPLLQAVGIATETVGNSRIRGALSPLPGQLKSGKRFSQSLGDLQIFDSLALNLVKVGEETGRLGPMMLEVSGYFTRDVETGIKRGITLLEPLLILVLGGLVAAIIVSILLGILAVNDLAL